MSEPKYIVEIIYEKPSRLGFFSETKVTWFAKTKDTPFRVNDREYADSFTLDEAIEALNSYKHHHFSGFKNLNITSIILTKASDDY